MTMIEMNHSASKPFQDFVLMIVAATSIFYVELFFVHQYVCCWMFLVHLGGCDEKIPNGSNRHLKVHYASGWFVVPHEGAKLHGVSFLEC